MGFPGSRSAIQKQPRAFIRLVKLLEEAPHLAHRQPAGIDIGFKGIKSLIFIAQRDAGIAQAAFLLALFQAVTDFYCRLGDDVPVSITDRAFFIVSRSRLFLLKGLYIPQEVQDLRVVPKPSEFVHVF